MDAVVLVTRQGCHLCDDALRLLHDLGVEPQLADVDGECFATASYLATPR